MPKRNTCIRNLILVCCSFVWLCFVVYREKSVRSYDIEDVTHAQEHTCASSIWKTTDWTVKLFLGGQREEVFAVATTDNFTQSGNYFWNESKLKKWVLFKIEIFVQNRFFTKNWRVSINFNKISTMNVNSYYIFIVVSLIISQLSNGVTYPFLFS